MIPPTQIQIQSDGNILKYVYKQKDGILIYQYSKSKTKLNEYLKISEELLSKNIFNNLMKEL